MNLANRPPLGLKEPKPKKNPAHMARVAKLPCVICGRWPVEVHHVICGRYSQRKAPDDRTIPLCKPHHDELHGGKESWVARYGEDTEYLPVVADALAGQLN